MDILLWMIAGIIMFAITIFVHRHSYDWRCDEKPLTLSRWVYWTWLLLALTPIANVVCFCAGAIAYIFTWANDDVHFRCEAKWWTKMVDFLNKDV